jgi:hypothetical protein
MAPIHGSGPFLCVPSRVDSLEVKVLFTDGGEVIAKRKGVTVRWGLKEAWRKRRDKPAGSSEGKSRTVKA